MPFINALYPFLVEHDRITTNPFGQKVKFKFASKTDIDIDNLSYEKDSPMNALIQEIVMSSCQCFPDDFEGNTHTANTINHPNIVNTSLQELDDNARISTTNKWDNSNIYTTSKWVIMASKGKALVQDYSQPKRLPARRPFKMHEGASSGRKSSGATSLQRDVPTEMTYSNGDITIALQEVLARNLQFHNGTYSELPASIKLILDNLQFAFIEKHHEVFQQTLRALEIHLVNLTAQNKVYAHYYANRIPEKTFISEDDFVLENEAFRSHHFKHSNITNDLYLSQLFGKEDIHSKEDRKSVV